MKKELPKILSKYYDKAKLLLCNEQKLERFLNRLEKKLKKIPKWGNKLSYATIYASFLNSYFHKTYTKAPIGIIIAILSALIYLVSPMDLLPDFILGLGYLDDAGAMATCFSLIKSDIDKYQEWRNSNKEN